MFNPEYRFQACVASPVRRDVAAVSPAIKEEITDAELNEMKTELEKEMSPQDAEKAVDVIKKLASNDTNSEEAVSNLVSTSPYLMLVHAAANFA